MKRCTKRENRLDGALLLAWAAFFIVVAVMG